MTGVGGWAKKIDLCHHYPGAKVSLNRARPTAPGHVHGQHVDTAVTSYSPLQTSYLDSKTGWELEGKMEGKERNGRGRTEWTRWIRWTGTSSRTITITSTRKDLTDSYGVKKKSPR